MPEANPQPQPETTDANVEPIENPEGWFPTSSTLDENVHGVTVVP